MTRWLPISLVLFGLILVGCKPNQPSQTKRDQKSDGIPQPSPTGVPKEQGDGQPEKKSSPKVVDAKPDFILTDAELAKEFAQDKEAAMKKYNGKTLAVTGTFKTFMLGGKDFHLKGHVDPKDLFGGKTVLCSPPEELLRKAHRLSEGQKVKVIGKIEAGYSYVHVSSIEELEKGTFVVVESVDLAREFAKDKDSAEKKYKGAGASGVIKGISPMEKPFDNFVMVELPGFDKTKFVVAGVRKADAEKLKKGEKAEFRGMGIEFEPEKQKVTLGGGWPLAAK